MSSLLFSASITLLLLSILPLSTPEELLDTDGDPIYNGGQYYITSLNIYGSKGPITLQKTDDYCPYYITADKTENSRGIPVRINSPYRTQFISFDQPVSMAFTGRMPCHYSPVWGRTFDRYSRREYITIDGSNRYRPFIISKNDESDSYGIKVVSPDGNIISNVGFFEDNGLLGLTENSTAVTFKKAFYYANNPQLSTS
ncbi:kunitz-type trypsin inhibitor alpha chain-like [Silene latifolia]|uniref:kunitz-type trypsin inhibitor alpha chain-like n=1 Tax=Silene latifolia TaxID=37657 RepID=UPI003D771245